jgi:hypothetical protein
VTSSLDDALRRTAAAVEHYHVDQKMIGVVAGSLTPMPLEQRAFVEVAGFTDAIVRIADTHDGPHDGCDMCAAIGNGLAAAMGVVRAETDLQLKSMLGEA